MSISEALTPTTQAQKTLIRYRSDYICRTLYRVFHAQRSWQTMATHYRYDGSTVEDPKGSVEGAKYLYVEIDAEASLGIARHAVILWQGDLKAAFKSMRLDEQDAWQEMLLRDRWAAIWHVRRSRRELERAPTTRVELSAACYKIAKLARVAV